MYYSTQVSQVQQIFLGPLNADWINSFSLGYISRTSLSTEQLPETGSVYYEKADSTALFSP